MAFVVRNLSVLAYANGFTLWHYKAGDESLAAVEAVDYFTPADDLLAEGDIVMLSTIDGARILAVRQGAHTAALD